MEFNKETKTILIEKISVFCSHPELGEATTFTRKIEYIFQTEQEAERIYNILNNNEKLFNKITKK